MKTKYIVGAICVALLIVVLIILSGLAVDVGHSGGCDFVPVTDSTTAPTENPCTTPR